MKITRPKLNIKSLFFIIMGLSTFLATALYFLTKESFGEYLTEHPWCITSFTYQGKDVPIKTTGITLLINNCHEEINFYKDGSVSLPGMNSYHIEAQWEYRNDLIIISNTENHKEIYNGEYKWSRNEKSISLVSSSTRIEMVQNDIIFPF